MYTGYYVDLCGNQNDKPKNWREKVYIFDVTRDFVTRKFLIFYILRLGTGIAARKISTK